MKLLSGNCLFRNKRLRKISIYFGFFLLSFQIKGQQIANYVNNGSFENFFKPDPIYNIPYFWKALDSTKAYGVLMIQANQMPSSSFTFQYPKEGNNYLISQFYSFFFNNNRTYPVNRLKSNLSQGRSYCVKMYVNLTDQSTYGIDALGIYFGDNSLDTITKCTDPITYLTPQITNPIHNIITDTMNWVAVTGTFTANGNEKYLVIGNFRTNANTDTALANPTNLPAKWAEYLIDAVSCIEVNLPAYAGRDTIVTPGTPVFLGREPDFAIDPGCTWYQWPNMSVPIYDKAGLWVNPVVTTTYIVKQILDCSPEKWDTVVVTVDATVGFSQVSLSVVEDGLHVFPNPANDYLELKIKDLDLKTYFDKISIYNNLGQSVKEFPIAIGISASHRTEIRIEDLPEGVYLIQLSGSSGTVSKRFVISR